MDDLFFYYDLDSIKVAYKTNDKRRLTCRICKVVCTTPQDLVAHKSQHKLKNRISCEFCGIEFKFTASVYNHRIKVHNVRKRKNMYRCELCMLRFLDVHDMKLHMVTHSEKGQCSNFNFNELIFFYFFLFNS